MATLQQKAKAIVAAEKRLNVVAKRRARAQSRLQSAEELQANFDTADAAYQKGLKELEWVNARPIEGEDEDTAAELETLLAELRPKADEADAETAGEDASEAAEVAGAETDSETAGEAGEDVVADTDGADEA